MIASKLPGIINPSDAYTDDVLKSIKNTIKSNSGAFAPKYEGTKTFTRNDQSYLTYIEDEEKYWREKFSRRKKNLQNGFFSDKAKPYQTMGKVYLESGDLILSSLTEELKRKISEIPEKTHGNKWGKVSRGKKTTPQQKKRVRDRTIEKLNTLEASAGFAAIKDRLKEVKLMRKRVYATQSLGAYLLQKEEIANDAAAEKPESDGIKSAVRNHWNIGLSRAVGKVMGGMGTEAALPSLAQALLKKGVKRRFLSTGGEYDDIEDEEVKLNRWKREKKKVYVQQKLQAINSIFCSLYNMKSKTIKSQVPLQGKFVIDLMRQDIALDQYGKPISCRGMTITDDTVSVFSDGSNTPMQNTYEAAERQAKTPSGPSNGVERKRTSSIALGTPRKARLSTLAAKYRSRGGTGEGNSIRIETWEDLLNAGERSKKASTMKSSGYGGKYAKTNTRKAGSPAIPGGSGETSQPWCTVAQAEKAIEEKHKTAVPGSIIRKTADDVLHDLRLDFVKVQKKISKDVEDELAKRKGLEFKLMQNKFNTITVGPITSVALEKMRLDAQVLTRDRKDNTTQPLQWFTDLQEGIQQECALKDENINNSMQKIARFKYEDGKNIPLAKEKLCLLVMSMPAHILMNASMIHAILFVLVVILKAAPELLDVWLSARKLSKLRRVETSVTPRFPKYN